MYRALELLVHWESRKGILPYYGSGISEGGSSRPEGTAFDSAAYFRDKRLGRFGRRVLVARIEQAKNDEQERDHTANSFRPEKAARVPVLRMVKHRNSPSSAVDAKSSQRSWGFVK